MTLRAVKQAEQKHTHSQRVQTYGYVKNTGPKTSYFPGLKVTITKWVAADNGALRPEPRARQKVAEAARDAPAKKSCARNGRNGVRQGAPLTLLVKSCLMQWQLQSLILR